MGWSLVESCQKMVMLTVFRVQLEKKEFIKISMKTLFVLAWENVILCPFGSAFDGLILTPSSTIFVFLIRPSRNPKFYLIWWNTETNERDIWEKELVFDFKYIIKGLKIQLYSSQSKKRFNYSSWVSSKDLLYNIVPAVYNTILCT